MHKFVEFSTFSQQRFSPFNTSDLKILRLFFECIQLAEDSHLTKQVAQFDELRQEFHTAVKHDQRLDSLAKQLRSYRNIFQVSVHLDKDSKKLEAHQLRKEFIKKFKAPEAAYLNHLTNLLRGKPEAKSCLRRLSYLARDPSLYLESYSTKALVELGEMLADIPILNTHIINLKDKHAKKIKLMPDEIYRAGVRYLDHLKSSLAEFKLSLCENLLDRLEKASLMKNIYYSDNLFMLVEEINQLMDSEADHLNFPQLARYDLSHSSFMKAQNLIRQYGSQNQIQRLNKLSWNQANDHFKSFSHSGYGIEVVPTELLPWVIQMRNWLWYLCSAAYRYRYQFLKRYAHLIAQQKLLTEYKVTILNELPLITQDKNLTHLQKLETELCLAIKKMQQDEQEEKTYLFKSNEKLSLISAYRHSLVHSLRLVVIQKITILSAHAEEIKIHLYAPEISQQNYSRSKRLYSQEKNKAALLKVHNEIEQALTFYNLNLAEVPKVKWRATSSIIKRFYNLEPATETKPNKDYEVGELEKLANTPIQSLLSLSTKKLNFRLEHLSSTYRILMEEGDYLTRCSIEQALYQFTYNYLNFVQSHLETNEIQDDKLSLIENSLINTNPIATNYLIDIQQLRLQPDITQRNEKLSLQISVTLFSIKPEIDKRSAHSTIQTPPAANTRHAVPLISCYQELRL